MKKAKHVVTLMSIALLLVWITGCGGCKKPPVLQSVSPSSGPEDGGTSVRLTGESFAEGATVTFGGKAASNVSVTSKTEITAVTPSSDVGSVNVTVTNPEVEDKENTGTLVNGFTYFDSTPPEVTSVSPADGTVISDYEDSLAVDVPISVTFSEAVTGVSIAVEMTTLEDALRQESGSVAGTVSGSGTSYSFVPAVPLKAARKYTVTVSGAKDASSQANAMQGTETYSFSIQVPERVHFYTIRKEDVGENGRETLMKIASRPETYDDPSRWGWIVEANQDYNMVDHVSAPAGVRLLIPWWERFE